MSRIKQLPVGAVFLLLATTSFFWVSSASALTPEEQLGKELFFDTNLSTPIFQSCAVCHLPTVGWTGPDTKINAHGAVYEGAVHGRFGNRKPPSAAYATLSPVFYQDNDGNFVGGNFWDGRATGENLGNPAADQALGPFLNPVEQNNPSKKAVCEKVKKAQYAWLWEDVWGEPIACDSMEDVEKNYDRIGLAIAEYEDSYEVNQFSSKYDAYLSGMATLTEQESWGLELFEGKAMCSACHPSQPGPDGEPPLFTDFTYDNLGVPKNPENPFYQMDKVYLDDGSPINPEGANWIDPGLGGFLWTRPEWKDLAVYNRGKHKVPTLRNVDLRPHAGFVKAFMHNGVFKSLEEVVHFYNTRDVEAWPPPEVAENVNTEELGDLGLTAAEEEALVAFLKTLSDGYMDPPDGQDLYDAYCLGCHGSPDPQDMYPAPSASRKVIGARPCSIKGAIYGTYVFKYGVKPMRFMQGSFTEEQIMMISDYLNSFADISGEQRYVTTCAGCHGIKAMGGRVDEEVRGEDAYEIKEAIYDERPMRFLKCLPSHDVYAIGDYLKWYDYDDEHDSNDDDDEHDSDDDN